MPLVSFSIPEQISKLLDGRKRQTTRKEVKMPNPKPTFDKINDMLVVDAIDEIIKDLNRAVEDYNTKFGREMLGNAIKKLKALREAHSSKQPKKSTIEPIGDGGYVLTETFDA